MSIGPGSTAPEIREFVHEYQVQPHGQKGAWLLARNVPNRRRRSRRRSNIRLLNPADAHSHVLRLRCAETGAPDLRIHGAEAHHRSIALGEPERLDSSGGARMWPVRIVGFDEHRQHHSRGLFVGRQFTQARPRRFLSAFVTDEVRRQPRWISGAEVRYAPSLASSTMSPASTSAARTALRSTPIRRPIARIETPARASRTASAFSSRPSPGRRLGTFRRRRWENTVARWIPYRSASCLTPIPPR